MKVTSISGPINIIRLENKNTNQVIHIHCDMHLDLQNQTECTNFDSEDIKTYLLNGFTNVKNNNKEYDFFVEDFPYYYKYNQGNYTRKYFLKVRKLVSQLINIDKNNIKKSEHFPNIRFHYIDIRDRYAYDLIFNKSAELLDFITYINTHGILAHDKIKILEILQSISLDLSVITKTDKLVTAKNYKIPKTKANIFDSTNTAVSTSEIDNVKIPLATEIIFAKIYHVYHNDNVKKILNYILNTHKTFYDDKIQTMYKKLIKILKDLNPANDNILLDSTFPRYTSLGISTTEENKIYSDLFELCINLHRYIWDLAMLYMDIYVLRKFLDKNYVKNAAIYTGAHHSHFYTYILIKYFGFVITHVGNVKKTMPQINDLNNIIKNIEIFDRVQFNKWFMPDVKSQCTSIINLPQIFE